MHPRAAYLLGGGVCIAVGWAAGGSAAQETRLTFLAVGQGDCVVFQHRGGTIIVDTGPSPEAAKYTILRELRRLGVSKIDMIFLSHPDWDHVAGTGEILKSYPGTKVAVSEKFRTHVELLALLDEWQVEPVWLPRRMRGRMGTFSLDFWNPQAAVPDNDASTIMRIGSGKASVLLSGDAGAETEAVAASESDWGAQVMKAGHHGSRTSTSWLWLREVRPQYVVLSCGLANSYGHPHPEVLERIRAVQATPLRTDRQGSVSFVLRSGRFVPANY